MENLNKVEKVILNNNGLVHVDDLKKEGISLKAVSRLYESKHLIRVKRGYYCLPGYLVQDELIISKLIPEAVICLESALFFHGYIDFTPRAWSIAIPRSLSRTKVKIDGLKTKPYFIEDKYYNIGVVKEVVKNLEVKVYDKERTICDCFKYRNKLDEELFNKAVKAYSKDEDKNLSNLSIYAKKLRVHNKLSEYMGVLING